jgi:hypothetical protein
MPYRLRVEVSVLTTFTCAWAMPATELIARIASRVLFILIFISSSKNYFQNTDSAAIKTKIPYYRNF